MKKQRFLLTIIALFSVTSTIVNLQASGPGWGGPQGPRGPRPGGPGGIGFRQGPPPPPPAGFMPHPPPDHGNFKNDIINALEAETNSVLSGIRILGQQLTSIETRLNRIEAKIDIQNR